MQIFEKLTEIPMNTWIALAAIVIFGVVLLAAASSGTPRCWPAARCASR